MSLIKAWSNQGMVLNTAATKVFVRLAGVESQSSSDRKQKYHRPCYARGPKDYLNIRIPQTMVSGILLVLGLQTPIWDPHLYLGPVGPLHLF